MAVSIDSLSAGDSLSEHSVTFEFFRILTRALSGTGLLSPIQKLENPRRFWAQCTGARFVSYAALIGLQLPLSGTWPT